MNTSLHTDIVCTHLNYPLPICSLHTFRVSTYLPYLQGFYLPTLSVVYLPTLPSGYLPTLPICSLDTYPTFGVPHLQSTLSHIILHHLKSTLSHIILSHLKSTLSSISIPHLQIMVGVPFGLNIEVAYGFKILNGLPHTFMIYSK